MTRSQISKENVQNSPPIQKHLILLRALNVLFCVVGWVWELWWLCAVPPLAIEPPDFFVYSVLLMKPNHQIPTNQHSMVDTNRRRATTVFFPFFNWKEIWLFFLGTSRTSQPWCLSNKCTIPTKCDALGRGKRTSVPIIPDSVLIILWQQRYDDWPHTSFQIYSFSYY